LLFATTKLKVLPFNFVVKPKYSGVKPPFEEVKIPLLVWKSEKRNHGFFLNCI